MCSSDLDYAQLTLEFWRGRSWIQRHTHDAATKTGKVGDDEFNRVTSEQRDSITSADTEAIECTAHRCNLLAELPIGGDGTARNDCGA